MGEQTPIPGWYPDAPDSSFMRWWDGTGWTEHRQPLPAAALTVPAMAVSVNIGASNDAVAGDSTVTMPPPADAQPRGVMMQTPVGTTRSDDLRTAPPPGGQMLTRRERRALEGGSSTSADSSALDSADSDVTFGVPVVQQVEQHPRETRTAGMIVPSSTGPTGVVPLNPGPVDTRALASSALSAASAASPPRASAVGSAPTAAPSAQSPVDAAWAPPPSFAVPQSAAELASVDYEPMGRNWARSAPARTPAPSRSSTVGGWMLAVSPLVVPVVMTLLGVALTAGNVAALPVLVAERNLLVLGGSLAAISVLSVVYLIVAVVIDRRRLVSLGHTHRASAWWILLGPFIYLIARTVRVVRESGKGTAPLWVFIATSVVITSLVIAAPFVVPRSATIAEMRAVESRITADLASEALVAQVLCPDSADARIGSTFRCDALDDAGSVVGLITVRWAGINGAIEYSLELADLPAELEN